MSQLFCQVCTRNFKAWSYVFECDNCHDGVTDSYTRDIDYSPTGFTKCHVCRGAGERSILREDFCCADCMNEYFDAQNET